MSVFLSKTHGQNKYKIKSNQSQRLSLRQKSRNKITDVKSTYSPSDKISSVSSTKNNITSTSLRQKSSVMIEKRNSDNLFTSILFKLLRLGITGVALSAILGTFLANRDLTKPLNLPFFSKVKSSSVTPVSVTPNVKTPVKTITPTDKNSLVLKDRLKNLEVKFSLLKSKNPTLGLGAFFIDLDNGNYASFNGDNVFPAASTIKIPILIAFFQDVDAGKIFLDQKLIMTPKNMVTGSGDMQYQKPNSEFTAIQVVSAMIISSDNTATEMIIELLGGMETLNQRFQSWGLTATNIKNPLPDLSGTNTTSAKDLASLLTRISNGELISLKSRDRVLDIMRQTKTRTLLPQGLEGNATIAHKTGDIGSLLGDAGIIDIPNGKRYVGAVLVKRPHNDPSARVFIQGVSKEAYQHFKSYLPRQTVKK